MVSFIAFIVCCSTRKTDETSSSSYFMRLRSLAGPIIVGSLFLPIMAYEVTAAIAMVFVASVLIQNI